MRFLPIFAFLIITPIAVFAQTIVPGGYVSGNWPASGSPYLVQGEIIIDQNSTLSIEPGCRVIFQGHFPLTVYGRLAASGTEEDSIVFTAADTAEGWDGVHIIDLNSNILDSTKLEYCVIKKGLGRDSEGPLKNGGGLFIYQSSKLLINHCLITRNRTDNRRGVNGTNALISLNPHPPDDGTPGQSVTSGHGGAIYCAYSSPLIIDNVICSNHTGDAIGGRGGNGGEHSTAISSHPLQGGDGAPGGYVVSGDGGAIYLYYSSAMVYNNIFYGNYTGDATGGSGGNGGSAIYFFTPVPYAFGGNGSGGGDARTGKGGAVYCIMSFAILTNNLMYDNRTGDATAGDGGNGGDARSGGGFETGGNGGDGGIATAGGGFAVCVEGIRQTRINNCTVFEHLYPSAGIGGAGGEGGSVVSGSTGLTGNMGNGYYGEYVLLGSALNLNMYIANSVVWNNIHPRINPVSRVSFSCLEAEHAGIGNIVADPLFTSTTLSRFFLSHIETGQPNQSPCVDAGCPDSVLIIGSTRTDGLPDRGIVDMGYHNRLSIHQPMLSAIPYYFEFQAIAGRNNPENQFLRITNYGVRSFDYFIRENIPWLEVYPMSGGPVPPTDTLTLSVDISGMETGMYRNGILITAPGASCSPEIIPVNLTVDGPVLSVPQDSLIFNAAYGYGNPPDQDFLVINTGIDTLYYIVNEAIDWLETIPLVGQTVDTGTVVVSVDITGLTYGTYTGDIVILGRLAANSPDTIHVKLNVVEQIRLSGNLSGVLQGGGIQYIVENDICVAEGDSLIIQPGATLLFNGDFVFTINGCLSAIGTENDSIKFLPNLNTHPEFTIWFETSLNTSSRVEYCRVSNSEYIAIRCNNDTGTVIANCEVSHNSGIGILCDNYSSPIINNCYIHSNYSQWNGSGIFCEYYSSPLIQNCIVTDNNDGGIHCYRYSDPIIDNCTISGNNSDWYGAGINCYYSVNPIIINCEIYNNSSTRSGGGIYCYHNSAATVENCRIYSNTTAQNGGGLGVFNSSSLELRSCLIYGNTALLTGGGISVSSGSVHIDRCSISDNCTDSIGGGIYTFNSRLNLDNSIVEGSRGTNGVYLSAPSVQSINNCDFSNNQGGDFGGVVPPYYGQLCRVNTNGDSCDFYYNIYLVPLFVNPDSGDYRLQWNSPCIDAGDPASPFDPDCTIADIGTFYFDQSILRLRLIPSVIPVNIPASGGDFIFNIGVDNLLSRVLYIDVWTEAILPRGCVQSPLLLRTQVGFQPGITQSPEITQYVPANAPPGNIQYIGKAGYPDTVYAGDSFYVIKLPGDAPPAHNLGWACSGWDDDEENTAILPSEFALHPSYPNPFNPAAALRFDLPKACEVRLTVYDIAGREIAALAEGFYPAGRHSTLFDASGMASGVYFARLQAGEFSQTRKLLLIK